MDSTAASSGRLLRVRMVWNAWPMANSAGTGSAQSCGADAWPPLPRTVILKPLAAAIMGPAQTPNVPASMPGQLCMPNTASQEALEQPVLDHGAGAGAAFLGRLEAQVHRAVEAAVLLQVAGRGQQHGGVAVMAAAVHLAVMARTVFELVFLLHRQGVHVGAQHDGAVRRALAQHADHAGLGDAGMDLDAPAAQRAGHHLGGAVLFVAQLRMGVQIAPQRHDVFQVR